MCRFFLTIQGELTDYSQSLDLGKNSRPEICGSVSNRALVVSCDRLAVHLEALWNTEAVFLAFLAEYWRIGPVLEKVYVGLI